MITTQDFNKKQILFVLANDGEKISIKNDNVLVSDKNGQTKIQVTCYRIYLINIIGNISLTSVVLRKAKKFGFFIALYSTGFHLYQLIGAEKEGNTLLRIKQYAYQDIFIAQHIVKNKIATEYEVINSIREKNDYNKESIKKIKSYYYEIDFTLDNKMLLSYEGLSAKCYFKNVFDNVEWKGRKPRIKKDIINSSLDIGYTLLFNFIDAILLSFGFDTYYGVYHKQFYMRKSLTCDIIEPFRFIIDKTVKKAFNLGKIKEDDFEIINGQYKLKWNENAKYVSFLMEPIINDKDLIFLYIQFYYRAFMKNKCADEFPFFIKGGIINGTYKL